MANASISPARKPKTVTIASSAQYDRLYSDAIVDLINGLSLPRYGLGLFVDETAAENASPAEQKQIENLSRAGKRLMGFCRTNLFKRLESSGSAFMQSVERHIQRNQIFLHAIDNDLPLPIGSLDAGLLDPDFHDEDDEAEPPSGDFGGAAYAMPLGKLSPALPMAAFIALQRRFARRLAKRRRQPARGDAALRRLGTDRETPS